MSKSRVRTRRTIRLTALVGGALAATLVAGTATAFGVPVPTIPPKPGTVAKPNAPAAQPSQSQVDQASSAKQAAAQAQGEAAAKLAGAQQKSQDAQAAAELAQQKYAFAYTKAQDAQDKLAQATDQLTAAQKNASAARVRFIQYIQAQYAAGQPQGLTGVLLSSTDPSALLDQSALQQYQSEANLTTVDKMQTATVAVSNAVGAKKIAKKQADTAEANAKQVKIESDQTFAQAKIDEDKAATDVAYYQNQYDQASITFATLNGQRATYVAYIKAQRAYNQNQRDLKAYENGVLAHNAAVATNKRIAQEQAEAAKNKKKHKGSGGGSSGGGGGGGGSSSGGGGGGSSSPAPPTGGSWTAAKGRQAVARAKSTLGTPYAWAGGGRNGPGYGVCDSSSGAPNDCNVYGYDCSGLALYAWHAYWDHYTVSQYSQAGSYHPSRSNLKPGDLLFWSNNGSRSGIHHVAIYVGNGEMIEAPYSGGYVQYNSIYAYSGYYGATRPLT